MKKLVIEKKAFDVFMEKFQSGSFAGQRLGQAFYNEFKLHKLKDQSSLHNLYAKDGSHAVSSIKAIFEFH